MSDPNLIEPQEGNKRPIPLVTVPSREYLNPRQLQSYRKHREEFINWLLNWGKDPDEAEGYAYSTALNRAKYHDKFARWVWQSHGGYTTRFTHQQADDYLDELHETERVEDYISNIQKALHNLFAWRSDDGESNWDPRRNFTSDDPRDSPHDYLKRAERRQIEEAALEHGTVPHYNSLTPEERSGWKHLLAERFRKPYAEIGPDEFAEANGFFTPSLLYVSLDAGFRPIEVGRAKVSWADIDNGVLNIPKDQSTKNRDNWTISLRDETANMLELWMEERRRYDKYDDSPYLWLTRDGNRQGERTLNYLFRQLCDLAGINWRDRKLSFYAIRHSTGTYVETEGTLNQAADQLRHISKVTTQKYSHAPPEERRETLERI